MEKDPRSYRIIEGEQNYKNFTFTLKEVTDTFASKTRMVATDLEDANRGLSISANDISLMLEDGRPATDEFILGAGQTAKVNVSIKTQYVTSGTYEGKITVVGINATDATFSIKILVSKNLVFAYVLNLGGIMFGVLATAFEIILPKPGLKRNDLAKELLKDGAAIITGAVVVLIVFLGTVGAYYRTVTDFGANGIVDYAAAFLFGLGQYAAGNASGTIAKALQKKYA